jgi:hypothetical protein
VEAETIMAKIEIYQIYYSESTRTGLDPGFIPLDNLANDRPDWREYWVFRRLLGGRPLDAETYYGVFSPKFLAKTGLPSSAVHALIEAQGENADVIGFSPYFEHMAFALNIIEHAVMKHGNTETFIQSAKLIAPEFRIDQAVMTSLNTIFCNFFVAKGRFWEEWLRNGERLFAIAEDGLTALGQGLNDVVSYGAKIAPAKVFVMERLVSLLLWSQPQWTVKSFNPVALATAPATSPDFMVLDALKIAYTQTGAVRYLDVFRLLREQMGTRAQMRTSVSHTAS